MPRARSPPILPRAQMPAFSHIPRRSSALRRGGERGIPCYRQRRCADARAAGENTARQLEGECDAKDDFAACSSRAGCLCRECLPFDHNVHHRGGGVRRRYREGVRGTRSVVAPVYIGGSPRRDPPGRTALESAAIARPTRKRLGPPGLSACARGAARPWPRSRAGARRESADAGPSPDERSRA